MGRRGPLPPVLNGRLVLVSPDVSSTLVVLEIHDGDAYMRFERTLVRDGHHPLRVVSIDSLSSGLLLHAQSAWPYLLSRPDGPLVRADFGGVIEAPPDPFVARSFERSSLCVSFLDSGEEPLRVIAEIGLSDETSLRHELRRPRRGVSPGPLITSGSLLGIENPATAPMGALDQVVRLTEDHAVSVVVASAAADSAASVEVETETPWCVEPVNAFDAGSSIRIYWLANAPLARSGMLERVEIVSGRAVSSIIDDRLLERVSIDPICSGGAFRYLYAASGDLLIATDLERGESREFDLGATMAPSKPLFIRDPQGTDDGEGYLLVIARNREQARSELCVFDASSLAAGPVCTISLPRLFGPDVAMHHLAPKPSLTSAVQP